MSEHSVAAARLDVAEADRNDGLAPVATFLRRCAAGKESAPKGPRNVAARLSGGVIGIGGRCARLAPEGPRNVAASFNPPIGWRVPSRAAQRRRKTVRARRQTPSPQRGFRVRRVIRDDGLAPVATFLSPLRGEKTCVRNTAGLIGPKGAWESSDGRQPADKMPFSPHRAA